MYKTRYWAESIETLPRPKLAEYPTEQLRKHLEPRATHKAKRLVDLRGAGGIRSRGEGI